MAMCPQCWESKPFFARRCSQCNSYITFLAQTIFQSVYTATALGGVALIIFLLYIGIRG